MSEEPGGGSSSPLSAAMRELLESGRIGQVVFVRWTETLVGAADAFKAAASSAIDALSTWFDARPDHMHELGTAENSNLTLAARWPGGQTAILALGPASRDSRPSIDLAVVGSEGAAYHKGPTTAPRTEADAHHPASTETTRD